MMIKYETYSNSLGEEMIRRINGDDTITSFGKGPANSDYQRYLRWLENPDAELGGTL